MTLSFSSSCSAAPLAPPRKVDRRLALKPDMPGFAFYEYQVCAKKFLGACVREETKTELFNLTDPLVWKEFISEGWTMISERRWQ